MTAAGEVFSRKPYLLASIDELIGTAGISRATFYLHFESKLALALAILDEIAPEWQALFDELRVIDARNGATLRAWVRRLVELYRSHGYISSLVVQVDVFEEEFHQRLQADKDALIDRLAGFLPAFRAARGPGAAARRARVRLRLLLSQLDHVCNELTLHGPVTDASTYIELVAEDWRALLAPGSRRGERA